jgi:hypothetical protein
MSERFSFCVSIYSQNCLPTSLFWSVLYCLHVEFCGPAFRENNPIEWKRHCIITRRLENSYFFHEVSTNQRAIYLHFFLALSPVLCDVH